MLVSLEVSHHRRLRVDRSFNTSTLGSVCLPSLETWACMESLIRLPLGRRRMMVTLSGQSRSDSIASCVTQDGVAHISQTVSVFP